MKKFLELLLAAMMALSCTAFAAAEEVDADLLAAAKAEGELRLRRGSLRVRRLQAF